jgi:ATP-dependent DNA helicase RecG
MIFKESEHLELKSSFGEWQEIIESLVAFANHKGGTVIVGINDAGEPLHMQIGKKTIEDFVNKIKTNTDPVLYPSINVKTFGLGEIVEISIPSSDYKPVFGFDKAWIRVGKSNIKLSAFKIRELTTKYTYVEIDKQEITTPPQATELDENVQSKLEQKGYTFNEKMNFAEYLCLIKQNNQFPQAIVKAARFKGDTPVIFLDNRDYNCSLIQITDQLLDFIRKNIRFQYIIKEKAERDERWENVKRMEILLL